MATNKSLKKDLKIMGESRTITSKESEVNNNDISLLNKEENLLNMDNSSLNNEGEKIIINFNISETPQVEVMLSRNYLKISIKCKPQKNQILNRMK